MAHPDSIPEQLRLAGRDSKTSARAEAPTRRALRVFFVLSALAALVPSWVGLAQTWDGSYTLYLILESRAPIASYARFTDLPLRTPVFLLSQLTADPGLLQFAFTLPYALLPLISLALAWWMVRERAPWLFVWSALGIGLATLPGQACYVCQAIGSTQIFYPILLALLIGVPRAKSVVVLALAVALFFFHPSAIPLFAFAAGTAILVGIRFREWRRVLWLWAAGFALASIAAEWKLTLGGNSYEAGQLSLAIVQKSFQTALAGLPLAALLCAGFAGLLIWLEPYLFSLAARSRFADALARAAYGAALASILLVGEFLFVWASRPQLWAQEIDFRILALFTSLPFMLLALGETLLSNPARWRSVERIWQHRARLCQATALVFLIVISTQSIVWQILTEQLRAQMNATASRCVSTSAVMWMADTPLNHWAITAYALLQQGRAPDQILMFGEGCTTTSFREGLPVVIIDPGAWDLRDWSGRWFDASAAGEPLIAQQSIAPSCQYPFTAGWDAYEGNPANWWRWTNSDATMRILVAEDTTATLSGMLGSLRSPNQVNVVVNGIPAATWNIPQSDPQTFPSLSLVLTRGENLVRFASQNPPASNPGDNRSLAIVLANLQLTAQDGTVLCR